MTVTVRRESDFTWTVLVNGEPTIQRESYAVASAVAWHLTNPGCGGSESADVADSIRRHFEGRP